MLSGNTKNCWKEISACEWKRILQCYVYPVLKYSCESWTLNNDLIRRINSLEQRCYRRILKIKWTDKVSNEAVLERMQVRKAVLYNSIQKQKLAFAGHILRGSNGDSILQILDGKLEAQLAQGRPRRMWLDDIKNWTNLETYEAIRRAAEDRCYWTACTAACQPSEQLEDDSWWWWWWWIDDGPMRLPLRVGVDLSTRLVVMCADKLTRGRLVVVACSIMTGQANGRLTGVGWPVFFRDPSPLLKKPTLDKVELSFKSVNRQRRSMPPSQYFTYWLM